MESWPGHALLYDALLYDDVHQFVGYDNHLDHLLSGEERLRARILQSCALEIILGRSKRRENPAAYLSIYLEHDFGGIFLGEFFVVNGPRLAEHGAGAAELFPQLLGDVGREGAEQQH